MKPKAIKVNADYESVLFENRPQPKINQAMEFLAFFLQDAPVISNANYSNAYLDYVESITGKKPVLKPNGEFENWWGELKDQGLERRLNDKLISSEFSLYKNWIPNGFIVKSLSDIESLPVLSQKMLAKNPYEMAGRGFRNFPSGIDESEKLELKTMLKRSALIIEPLLDRIHDFSHYVFPDQRQICYENLVDQKFQYKGSVFKDWNHASVENLSFYHEASEQKWKHFKSQLQEIKNYYQTMVQFSQLKFGFSIDSLVYLNEKQKEILPLCEVNFRRTMGRITFELSEVYAKDLPWACLLLLPVMENSLILCRKYGGPGKVIHLSPEGARFTILFMAAEHVVEAREMKLALEKLLPLGQLPIHI